MFIVRRLKKTNRRSFFVFHIAFMRQRLKCVIHIRLSPCQLIAWSNTKNHPQVLLSRMRNLSAFIYWFSCCSPYFLAERSFMDTIYSRQTWLLICINDNKKDNSRFTVTNVSLFIVDWLSLMADKGWKWTFKVKYKIMCTIRKVLKQNSKCLSKDKNTKDSDDNEESHVIFYSVIKWM